MPISEAAIVQAAVGTLEEEGPGRVNVLRLMGRAGDEIFNQLAK